MNVINCSTVILPVNFYLFVFHIQGSGGAETVNIRVIRSSYMSFSASCYSNCYSVSVCFAASSKSSYFQLAVFIDTSLNTFKYHVSCIDGKISVRINLLFYLFFTVVPSNTCVFLSCRPFVVNTTFLTPTRPFENVVLTTKGLQERNTQVLDGTTMKNRQNNKLILTFLGSLSYLILLTWLYNNSRFL